MNKSSQSYFQIDSKINIHGRIKKAPFPHSFLKGYAKHTSQKFHGRRKDEFWKLQGVRKDEFLRAPNSLINMNFQKNETYFIQKYQRSNQDTLLVQRPFVRDGDWVQSGDLLADCSSSLGGELSLGKIFSLLICLGKVITMKMLF